MPRPSRIESQNACLSNLLKKWLWLPDAVMAKITIEGGRRHQIRVHMAAIGHPLVGDVLYGAKPISWRNGHALHADMITLPNGQVVISTHHLPKDRTHR
jgi:23S rRNA-/tRNA-specific pseudouridylate synthase